jgi:nucleoside-diphosphate-sugar epimerase
MKILITGGAGYLGSMVTAAMLGQGHQVTVVDTFEHGFHSLAFFTWSAALTIQRRDARLLAEKDFKEFDVVIPLAAVVGQAACDQRRFDAESTNRVAIEELCKRVSADQVVISPCTNSGYGIGEKALMCTEESPLNPVSTYGRQKVEAEKLIMQRENSVSLRLATLFGWSMRMRRDLLVNDLTWRAVRDHSVVVFEKDARRNFCHVRDAALAFLHVLQNWSTMRGQVYNVGDTTANMTKLQLCERIKAQVPNFLYLAGNHSADPDKRDYLVSNDKIEATGWKPRITLDDGIAELIRGYNMLKREEYGNV